MVRPEFTCTVKVAPLSAQQTGELDGFAFAYTITIVNTGNIAAQLIARHWVISDERGHVQQVRGLAVVGQQPLLKPGERFEYTSWTPLATPSGSMRGTFFCMTEDAHAFEADIPEFVLAVPTALH